MRGDIQKHLLQKEMTRKEFLQFAGGSLVILFGLTNILALFNHFSKTANSPAIPKVEANHGFGSRTFGA